MTWTHPHMKVARMEAAVEVLGMKISKLSTAIDDERNLASPDQSVIATMQAQRALLCDQQDDLSVDDLATVARILDEQAANL